MTYEQAIDGLKNLRLFMELEDKTNENKFNSYTYESVNMGIETLEKQIPQKPVNIIEAYKIYSSFDCPSCDCTIRDDFTRFRCYRYCPCCGQKLKWGDEE